jgi:enolase-phosphatase E1
LIFRPHAGGDLTPRISQFFDATIGPKREADSYRTLRRSCTARRRAALPVGCARGALGGARSGFKALLCVRPGNAEPPREDETTIQTFDDIIV